MSDLYDAFMAGEITATPEAEKVGGGIAGIDWSGTLTGLANLATTGVNIYSQLETAKAATARESAATTLAQTQAQVQTEILKAQAAAQAATAAYNAVPWYKQAWVMPVAIGAGLLLLLGVMRARR
jgi:ElaB/YqjD/DUF883 family membrane-anchored ribosome-binding protein